MDAAAAKEGTGAVKYPEEILRERIAVLTDDVARARDTERQAILDWIGSCYWGDSHFVHEICRGIQEGRHVNERN